MQPQVSIEARRPIKVFAGILQIVSVIVIVADIIDHFSPFGFPNWAIYLGIVCYFIGTLCGMKITWFSQRR